jgi:leucyl-tRNA synthetase
MHKDVVFRFIEVIALMMSPICPHWCEHIWISIGREGLVCQGLWPKYEAYDKLLRKQYIFFREAIKNARQAALKSKAASPKSAYIYIASAFDEKKKEVLRFLARHCSASGEFSPDLLKLMKEFVESSAELKPETKFLMQFGAFMRDEAKERGPDALAVEQPFDQQSILEVKFMFAIC